MTLTERVARAICRQWNIDDGYADNETLRRSIEMGMWRNHLEQAQAAISAIEASETHVVAPVEATEEMIAVGWVSGPHRLQHRRAHGSGTMTTPMTEPVVTAEMIAAARSAYTNPSNGTAEERWTRALLAALRLAPSPWRPIAEAPRDGTEIIV